THPAVERHVDGLRQQFDAGQLGVWLVVATELMFFSALFCASTPCRSAHPEVFQFAHYYMRPWSGALATCVLLLSSLSATFAVRSIQRGDRAQLARYGAVTLFCGVAFLAMQGVEYGSLIKQGLLPGAAFDPTTAVWNRASFHEEHPTAAGYALRLRALAHGDLA